MDVSKFNVLSWLKVLVACLALVLSGCGGSDRKSGTVDPEEHQSSDEGEEEAQDDEDKEKGKGEELSFLDKVAKEKGTCFAGKEVKSLNVYVPFLDFGKDGVVESDDFLAKVAPEVSILHLSDDVVIGDLAEMKGKKGLSTDKVQEGVSADDVQYVKYTFQGKIVAEFKKHDEIFEVFDDGDFLDNEEAKGHLLYYEFIKTYFGKKGNFKLGVNGKTFVATSDSSLFSFEFDGIKEVKKGMAEEVVAEEENEEVVEVEDVVEEEDAGSEVEAEVVEEEEAANEEAVEVVEETTEGNEEAEAVVVEEGSEGAESTSSSEGTVVEVTEDSAQEEVAVSEEEAEEEKDVTYYEADVIATYYLADFSDNAVQVKNAAVCAEEKEAAEKEAAEKESEDTKAEEGDKEESSAEGDDAAESDAAADSDADAETEDATEDEAATDEVADEDAEESSAEGASDEEGTVAETEDATDEEVDSETEEEATTSEEEDSVSQGEEEKVSS